MIKGTHVKIDDEILRFQPLIYREKFEKFARNPTLNTFSNLEKPNQLSWGKNQRTNKYFVKN